ncbi:PEP-CTERM sorting domain-containing protein [Parahaliea mediterranea]|uniref:PEP-CTERM sorting domain-containing protein n=1 Tax=Parahaliea mediterranea TaxID=651086 RepID=A0A939IKM2_9GAMM|nr:PEP-CTERM sorting domain-containing protein [Parahaliea mediterranea]MBN7797476.1 PEP-CTERM sorting domain-containing protein [Parahaliea mediterranea]
MKQLLKSCLLAAGLVAGTSAHAGLITTELNVDQFVGYWQSHTFELDVSGDPAFGEGDILGGQLSIELFDDNAKQNGNEKGFFGYDLEFDDPDFVTIIVEGLDGDSGEFSTMVNGLWTTALGPEALAAIAGDGLLEITVFGGLLNPDDFSIGRSMLSLETNGAPAAVPTPATLALFGLGLAGLGLTRRKAANGVARG